ncbi:unnamed protein product [Prorocentrum cordatum]|uniref:Uncharacterized protein n=1 Tax=Prorocentrum cordatum TaxID=2364126 RepID=A0ABN9QIU0_9DINO|nr:unnamed protein product [Polarella glacialis]
MPEYQRAAAMPSLRGCRTTLVPDGRLQPECCRNGTGGRRSATRHSDEEELLGPARDQAGGPELVLPRDVRPLGQCGDAGTVATRTSVAASAVARVAARSAQKSICSCACEALGA